MHGAAEKCCFSCPSAAGHAWHTIVTVKHRTVACTRVFFGSSDPLDVVLPWLSATAFCRSLCTAASRWNKREEDTWRRLADNALSHRQGRTQPRLSFNPPKPRWTPCAPHFASSVNHNHRQATPEPQHNASRHDGFVACGTAPSPVDNACFVHATSTRCQTYSPAPFFVKIRERRRSTWQFAEVKDRGRLQTTQRPQPPAVAKMIWTHASRRGETTREKVFARSELVQRRQTTFEECQEAMRKISGPSFGRCFESSGRNTQEATALAWVGYGRPKAPCRNRLLAFKRAIIVAALSGTEESVWSEAECTGLDVRIFSHGSRHTKRERHGTGRGPTHTCGERWRPRLASWKCGFASFRGSRPLRGQLLAALFGRLEGEGRSPGSRPNPIWGLQATRDFAALAAIEEAEGPAQDGHFKPSRHSRRGVSMSRHRSRSVSSGSTCRPSGLGILGNYKRKIQSEIMMGGSDWIIAADRRCVVSSQAVEKFSAHPPRRACCHMASLGQNLSQA